MAADALQRGAHLQHELFDAGTNIARSIVDVAHLLGAASIQFIGLGLEFGVAVAEQLKGFCVSLPAAASTVCRIMRCDSIRWRAAKLTTEMDSFAAEDGASVGRVCTDDIAMLSDVMREVGVTFWACIVFSLRVVTHEQQISGHF